MSHTIIGLEQAEEAILNCDVSDDALETAAGTRNEKAAAYTAPFALICIPFVAQGAVQDTATFR